LIYRYTQQDIPKAWQSALDFTLRHVIPHLRQAYQSQVASLGAPPAAVFQEKTARLITSILSKDPRAWHGHTLNVGMARRIIEDPARTNATMMLHHGQPAIDPQTQSPVQLTQAAEAMHKIYSTFMRVTNVKPGWLNLYGYDDAGAFASYESPLNRPPVRIEMKRWGNELVSNAPSEAFLHHLVHQTLPALQFLYYEPSKVQSQQGNTSTKGAIASLYRDATKIGMRIGEAIKLGKAYERVGNPIEDPLGTIAVSAHEFAHASLQFKPIIGTKLMEDYFAGKAKLSDLIKGITLAHEFLHEAQADIFAVAASLNPQGIIMSRYVGGAKDEIKRAAAENDYSFQRWKFGDPIRLRVIDPRVIEDPNSSLFQMIGRYAEAMEQALLTGRAKTRDKLANNTALDILVLNSSLANQAQSTDLKSPYNYGSIQSIALDAGESIVSALVLGVVKRALDPRRDLKIDEDAEFVLRHQASRFWTLGYMIGKGRPNLIGQEVNVTPRGITTDSGEVINLADVLPDVYPYTVGESEVHPVLLERAFNAVRFYENARAALRRGVRFVSRSTSPSEVIETWRQLVYKEVIQSPNRTVNTNPNPTPQIVNQASQPSRYQAGLQQAAQAQVVQQTSGQQVITGHGSNVIQAAKQQNPQP
jgi:hypothetical protein